MNAAQCGTTSGYTGHRRRKETPCAPCRAALAAYSREYRALTARSSDPAAIRRHIRQLQRHGVGYKAIAVASGTTTQTIWQIGTGQRSWVSQRVTRAIFAVTPADALLVDATGTQRRIRALCAIGWTLAGIGQRMGGIDQRRLSNTLLQAKVTRRRADEIAAVYDEIHLTRGPSRLGAMRAARAGWPPPLAWDEDTIDDPKATPDMGGEDVDLDPIVLERLASGDDYRVIGATRAERIAAAEQMVAVRSGLRVRLVSRGWGDDQIEAPSINRIAEHLGLRAGRDFLVREQVAS